jgi:hypothetical protein
MDKSFITLDDLTSKYKIYEHQRPKHVAVTSSQSDTETRCCDQLTITHSVFYIFFTNVIYIYLHFTFVEYIGRHIYLHLL